jgi:hypothetical protein
MPAHSGKPAWRRTGAEINRRLRADPDGYALRHAAERLAVLDRDTGSLIRLFGGDLATHTITPVSSRR